MHRYTGRCGRARKRPAERKKPGTQGRAATAALYTARVERADPRGAPARGAEEPERPLKARGLFFGEDDVATENDCIRCRGIAHFKHDSLHVTKTSQGRCPVHDLIYVPPTGVRTELCCVPACGRTDLRTARPQGRAWRPVSGERHTRGSSELRPSVALDGARLSLLELQTQPPSLTRRAVARRGACLQCSLGTPRS